MTPKKATLQKTTATDSYFVDPRNIAIIDGFNVRTDYGDIDSLAESIRESGVKVPLRCRRVNKHDDPKKVKDAEFVVTDGHRRLTAAMQLISQGEEIKIPVILEPRMYSEEQRILDMWRANDGKQLTPVERAEIVDRMIQRGWEIKDIAKNVGVTVTYINKLAQLAAAPVKLKNMVSKNVLSSTYALKILQESKSSEDAIEKIETALSSGNLAGGSDKPRVTASKVNKANKKVNGVSEFRKFVRKIESTIDDTVKVTDVIHQNKRETFDIVSKIINGEIDRKKLENYFTNER